MLGNFQKDFLTVWQDTPAPVVGHCEHAHKETGVEMGHALWKVIPEVKSRAA